MLKRGQITVFIVLGILTLGIIAGLFYFIQYSSQDKMQQESIQLTPTAQLKSYLDDCLEDSTQEVLRVVALQGGYYTLPKEYTFLHVPPLSENLTDEDNFLLVPVAYGLNKDVLTFPSLEKVETEIASATEKALVKCVNQFNSSYAPVTTQNKPNAKVKIRENSIYVQIEYPIHSEDTELRIFVAEIDSNYKELYQLAQELLEHQINNSWLEMYSYPNTKVEILNIDYNKYAFLITKKGLSLATAVQTTINYPPLFFIKESYTLKQHQPFSLQLNYLNDDGAYFEDDTVLFDISPEGAIEFTPEIEGNFTATITMYDESGQKDSQQVEFIIIPEEET